jgi:alpha-tubulin suppressor-like RCC1 family protein
VIAGPVRFVTVSVGASPTCGLTAGGEAWCWGANGQGEVGAGDWTIAYTPPASTTARRVAGGLTFRSLSAGRSHVCGLTTAGAAYCWGNNYYGQLGGGDTRNANAPVPVAGGLTFADISAGDGHTCAVTTAGVAHCWGDNGYGQLGGGFWGSPALTPTPVTGGLTFVSVSAGSYTTCGILVGGAAYCWGYNADGMAGTGSFSPLVLTPTPVTGGIFFQPSARRGSARR